MWIILAIISLGIITGYILRQQLNENILNTLVKYSIFLLLFLMGVGIGTNKQILEKLAVLSWQALLFTISTIAGSILVSILVYRLFFKNNK